MKYLKYSLIFLFLITFYKNILPQDSSASISFLHNISELKEIYKFNLIYDLDVFEYYDLNQYDTELKKKNFKKTSDYLSKADELKAKKKELLNTIYFIKWDGELSDYKIGQGGFNFSLGTNMNMGTAAANSPKTIGDIYFPSLPTKRITYLDNAYGSDVREEVLFIKMNEDIGGIIEDKLSEISFYLIFKICGKKKVSFKYNSMGDSWYNVTQEHFFANSVKLIIANDKTDEIYFEKEYK